MLESSSDWSGLLPLDIDADSPAPRGRGEGRGEGDNLVDAALFLPSLEKEVGRKNMYLIRNEKIEVKVKLY